MADAVEKPNKPKKKTIPKALRDKIWDVNFGDSMKGNCYCCTKQISYKTDYECGHVVAESKGGTTTEDNLKPVCKTCNKSMKTTNMEEFKGLFKVHVVEKKTETPASEKKEVSVPEKKIETSVISKEAINKISRVLSKYAIIIFKTIEVDVANLPKFRDDVDRILIKGGIKVSLTDKDYEDLFYTCSKHFEDYICFHLDDNEAEFANRKAKFDTYVEKMLNKH